MGHIFFTKLEYDWLLVSRNIDDSEEKSDMKIDKLTEIGRLVIKNPIIKNLYL